MKILSKGGGANPVYGWLLAANGERLTTEDGDFLYGEGLTVPTSIHEYMPHRFEKETSIVVTTVADDEDNPTNWEVAHTMLTDPLIAGTYCAIFTFLWQQPTTVNQALFSIRINGDIAEWFVKEEPKDAAEHKPESYEAVFSHSGGPILLELLALTTNAADPISMLAATLQVERKS